MGRFFKEFRYSLRAKNHIFFLVLIWMVACATVWLFYLSLNKELSDSFGDASAETSYRVAGSFDKLVQAENIDLKAELAFNKELHGADWMSYMEAAREDIYIQEYSGMNEALVGFEEGDYAASKGIKKSNKEYSYVKAIWLDKEAVKAFDLGAVAENLFDVPTNYTDRMYVVLGAKYKETGTYQAGDSFTISTDSGLVTTIVLGFLEKGVTARVNGKYVTMDNYILCPLLDLSNVYEGTSADLAERTALFINGDKITANAALDHAKALDENGNEQIRTSGDKTFVGYKVVWVTEGECTKTDAPSWMKNFYQASKSAPVRLMAAGADYTANGVSSGKFDILLFGVTSQVTLSTAIPAGSTYKGQVLDDCIVMMKTANEISFFGADSEEDVKTATTDSETTTEEPVTEAIVTPALEEFDAKTLTVLMHIMYMKNTGIVRTKVSANDAERKLMDMVDRSWKNFHIEKENSSPITDYRIKEASAKDSILFKDNVENIVTSLEKYTKYFIVGGMLILLLYYLLKRKSLHEHFTMLVITGTSNLEIMLFFLVESLLFLIGTVGFGYLFCFAVCKILQLKVAGYKDIVGIAAWMIVIPTVCVWARIFFTDYGKMFRRGK